MNYYDVTVIGAGPAGCRAAYNLAQLGYSVALLEKQNQAGNKLSCTGIIGRECVELFDIDRSCVIREARSAKLFAPSGDFIRVEKDETQAYIVDRIAFDRSLAQKAIDAGVHLLLNCKASDLIASDNGIAITIERQGEKQSLESKAAIIANGFGSNFSSKLKMGQIKNVITGAQVEVETNGIDEVEVYFSQKLAPGFFAWLAPIGESRARVGLFSTENVSAHLRDLLSMLQSQGKIFDNQASVAIGGIPLKPLSKTYSDRLLVAGDAAGQVKPTTGGGIYYGLLCADFASETLHQAFMQNDFSAKKLSIYQKLWKDKLGRELRIDYFARRLYNRLSDKRINAIFEVARDNNIHEKMLNSSSMSFDWHGEMILDGMKHLGPWRHLFGRYLPKYIIKSVWNRP